MPEKLHYQQDTIQSHGEGTSGSWHLTGQVERKRAVGPTLCPGDRDTVMLEVLWKLATGATHCCQAENQTMVYQIRQIQHHVSTKNQTKCGSKLAIFQAKRGPRLFLTRSDIFFASFLFIQESCDTASGMEINRRNYQVTR